MLLITAKSQPTKPTQADTTAMLSLSVSQKKENEEAINYITALKNKIINHARNNQQINFTKL